MGKGFQGTGHRTESMENGLLCSSAAGEQDPGGDTPSSSSNVSYASGLQEGGSVRPCCLSPILAQPGPYGLEIGRGSRKPA